MDNYTKGMIYSIDQQMTLTQLRKLTDTDQQYNFSALEKYLSQNNINFILDGDDDFHYKLSLVKSKPYIIYYIGNLSLLDTKILGIVGPRKCSTYGEKVIQQLFARLPNTGISTISGMAPGIDEYAHRSSIQYGIPTIAVLGGGFRHYLSGTRRHLVHEILDRGGLIMSEFKIDFEPTNYSFPQRNRIIAGLSDMLFLPEAGANSGSLITVDFALEMGKKVYGIPGSVFDDTSLGLNSYISQGKIQAISDIDDFVSSNFGVSTQPSVKDTSSLTGPEKQLLDIIVSDGPLEMNDMIIRLQTDMPSLMSMISSLEINGLIFEKEVGQYQAL